MRPMKERRQFALRDLLACPRCHGQLEESEGQYLCLGCLETYRIDGGIPIFVKDSAIGHDELDHSGSDIPRYGRQTTDAHKAGQAAYFDREAQAEFEIERPSGAPAFYRFLILEKFRRAVRPLGGRLDGWTALTVCGGSGMDAEFLARAGASVISSDISLGAAERTRERAKRHGIPILSIVADVEQLPFRNRAVDLAYVHDGLHHTEDPVVGLREMTRVAAQWVSINEPAKATATDIAVRLGLAQSLEESGNPVARLDPVVIAEQLHAAGFLIVDSHRYAMYYQHYPGRVFALLSRPWLLRAASLAWRVANYLVGPFGNKLAVVAERREG
jgi:SAM-dependent methyltransferase